MHAAVAFSSSMQIMTRRATDFGKAIAFAAFAFLVQPETSFADGPQSLAFGDLSIWSEFPGKTIDVRLCDEEGFSKTECQELAEDLVNRTDVEFIRPRAVAGGVGDPAFAEIVPECMRKTLVRMFEVTGPQQQRFQPHGPFAAFSLTVPPSGGHEYEVVGIRGYRLEDAPAGEDRAYAWTVYGIVDRQSCETATVDTYLHGADVVLSKAPRSSDGIVALHGRYFLYSVDESAPGNSWFHCKLTSLDQYAFGDNHIHYAVTWVVRP